MAWTHDSIDPTTGRKKYGQITTVQVYKRYAKLADQEYRALLKHCTGCTSSTHPSLTNYQFDKFMACLEARLDRAIQEGAAELPRGVVIDHWRQRWLREKGGLANYRIIHEIRDWWYKLQPYIPIAERTPEYCRSIASHACGARVESLEDLTAREACLVIEALKDRLRWALKKHPELQESGYEPVPTTSADQPPQEFAADQPDPVPVQVDMLHPEEDIPF